MERAMVVLREHGIQPTPQRLAVLQFIRESHTHPSADDVYSNVRGTCPTVSRATVYNTLNLLAEKGVIKTQMLREGSLVFDAQVHQHHHFIDDETGQIYDVPWEAVRVHPGDGLAKYEVREIQVVLRGKKRTP
jgi:Fur family transcriptional regulator, peroxide stress response regulator